MSARAQFERATLSKLITTAEFRQGIERVLKMEPADYQKYAQSVMAKLHDPLIEVYAEGTDNYKAAVFAITAYDSSLFGKV